MSSFIPENICTAITAGPGSGACGFNSYCTMGDDQRPYCLCPPGYTFLDPNDRVKGCMQDFFRVFYKSEAGVGSAGHSNFLKIKNRRWECRPLKFFKNQKPALGLPVFEILFKSRRCQRRSLPPVTKRTSLVIFLKTALEFGFLFF